MPTIRRTRNWSPVLLIALLGLHNQAIAEPPSPKTPLPPDNPYALAYTAVAGLSSADHQALDAGLPLSTQGEFAAAEVRRALAAGRNAASVDWGIDYTAGMATSLPFITDIRTITKLALTPVEPPSSATVADRAVDVLALARHAGEENLLLTLLVQRSVEQQAYAYVQKNLANLSPADASRLLAGMEKLSPGGDLGEALAVENLIFLDEILHEMRAALGAAADEPQPADGGPETLRMSGIVSENRGAQIGFELKSDAFWLKPGQSRHGVTLLNVDLATDEALLTQNGRLLRLKLSSKTLARVNLSGLAEAIKAAPPTSVLHLLTPAELTTDGAQFIRQLESDIVRVKEIYAEATAHPERFEDAEVFKSRLKGFSPMVASVVAGLPKIIAREKAAAAQKSQMQAALMRLSKAAAAATPPAPAANAKAALP